MNKLLQHYVKYYSTNLPKMVKNACKNNRSMVTAIKNTDQKSLPSHINKSPPKHFKEMNIKRKFMLSQAFIFALQHAAYHI